MTESHHKARDSAVRVVAVCGIVASLVPSDVLELFSDQPWRQIVDMRSLAAHQYDSLDPRRGLANGYP